MGPSFSPSRLALQCTAAFLLSHLVSADGRSPCSSTGLSGQSQRPRTSCLCVSGPLWVLCLAEGAAHCGAGLQGSVAERDRVPLSRVFCRALEPSSVAAPSAPCTASSPGAHKPGTDSVCLGLLPEKGAEVLAPVISKLSEKFSCSDIISFLCYYKELRSYYGIGGNSIEPFKINSDRKRDIIA